MKMGIRERNRLMLGLTIAATAALLGPIGLKVGFSSHPVGEHSNPRVAHLKTVKRADQSTVTIGGTTGYTITIQNPRRSNVRLNSITDTLPGGFAYIPGSTSDETTADPTISGRLLTWDGPFTVPRGNSIHIHFQVRVANVAGAYFNEASAVPRSNRITVDPTGPTARIFVKEYTNLEASPVLRTGTRVTARLTTQAGQPIEGRRVSFYAYGIVSVPCRAVTDFDGVAACGAVTFTGILATAGRGYYAEFAGDDFYYSSSDDAGLL